MVMAETMVVMISCVARIPYTLRINPHRSWFSPRLIPGYKVLDPPNSKSTSTSPPPLALLTFVYPNIFSEFLGCGEFGKWTKFKFFFFFWLGLCYLLNFPCGKSLVAHPGIEWQGVCNSVGQWLWSVMWMSGEGWFVNVDGEERLSY